MRRKSLLASFALENFASIFSYDAIQKTKPLLKGRNKVLLKPAPKAHVYGQGASQQFPDSAQRKVRLWWQQTPP